MEKPATWANVCPSVLPRYVALRGQMVMMRARQVRAGSLVLMMLRPPTRLMHARFSHLLPLAVTVMLSACGSTAPSPAVSTAAPSETRPVASGGPSPTPDATVTTIALPRADGLGVGWADVGGGALWISLSDTPAGHLLRLDGDTNVVRESAPIGWAPGRIAVTDAGVWVADTAGDGSRPQSLENHLQRVDPSTLAVVRSVSFSEPAEMTAAGNTIWVSGREGTQTRLARLDAISGAIEAEVTFSGPISGLSVAGGWLWATTGKRLLQLNLTTLRVDSEVSTAAVSPVVMLNGRAWCVMAPPTGAPAILVFPPATPNRLEVVHLPGLAGGWDVTDGQLLVVRSDHTFQRLDPLTGEAAGPRLPLPVVPGADQIRLLAFDGSYWEITAIAVIRIDPT